MNVFIALKKTHFLFLFVVSAHAFAYVRLNTHMIYNFDILVRVLSCFLLHVLIVLVSNNTMSFKHSTKIAKYDY